MNLFEKWRWGVYTQRQHPYRHDLTEFFYGNPAVPLSPNNVKEALDYIFAVIYPQYIGTFATPAALPVTANPNDYALVNDDGDGKAAGYVWIKRDGVEGWNKRYDIDWSMEAILAETENRTMYMYVHKYGLTDKDALGADIVGQFAGQSIYGGDAVNQSLTLFPNSFDTIGTPTGFIQSGATLRPTVDTLFDLGDATYRWANTRSANIFTDYLETPVITSPIATIDFDAKNLFNIGTLDAAGAITSQTSFIADNGAEVGVYNADSYTKTSGDTDYFFNAVDVRIPNGLIEANSLSLLLGLDTLTLSAAGSLNISTGLLDVNGADISNIGTATGTSLSFANATIGNIEIEVTAGTIEQTLGNLSIITSNGDIVFDASAGGDKLIFDNAISFYYDYLTDTLEGNSLASASISGIDFTSGIIEATSSDLELRSTGNIVSREHFVPSTDSSKNLGDTLLRWNNLFLSSAITDGTDSISIATILSFRDALVGAVAGATLFYDGTKWNPSVPDTEIDHGTISGLLDDDHTQYALLAGRVGGQTLIGGTAASNDLFLQSTSDVTRGFVKLNDDIAPATDASFAVTWSGTDVGDSTLRFRNVYTAGEFFGFRPENRTSDPAFSAANVGRLIYRTDTGYLRLDTGTGWINVNEPLAFINGGNSFGADATLGTNDTRRLIFETNGTETARFGTGGGLAIGVGTNTDPLSLITVYSNAIGSTPALFQNNAASTSFASVTIRRGRGSVAAPSAILSGDSIGNWGTTSYGTTAWAAVSRIFTTATENHTDTVRGTAMFFALCPNGSTTITNRLVISPNGVIVSGTAASSNSSASFEGATTDKAFLLNRLTNAQEAALTPVNGMVQYNSDLGEFRGYRAGSWTTLTTAATSFDSYYMTGAGGFGSTNTKVPYFTTTTVVSNGVTSYTNDATDGFTITAVKRCKVYMTLSFTPFYGNIGISTGKNTEGTTNFSATTATIRRANAYESGATTNDSMSTVACCVVLAIGESLKPHTAGSFGSTAPIVTLIAEEY